MKLLCISDLDRFRPSRRDNNKFRDIFSEEYYTLEEECSTCKNPYMRHRRSTTTVCSVSCSRVGELNPGYGKPGTMLGKKHTPETLSKMSVINKGSNNSSWKGGVINKNIPLYSTYAHQLEKYEPVHKILQDALELLGVHCLYCNKIFVPKQHLVRSRLVAINYPNNGDNRFYCSEGCKQACPIFWKEKWPEGYAPETSRETTSEFRKLVLERDNWTCQKCGIKDVELHCHHIDPIVNNPVESADLDNGITLCKVCHKLVHKSIGCTYQELRC